MLRYIIIGACILFAGHGYAKEYKIIVVEGAVTSLLPGPERPEKKITLKAGDQTRIGETQELVNHGNNTRLYVIDSATKRLLLSVEPYGKLRFADIDNQMQTSRFDDFVTAIGKVFIYESDNFQGGKRLDDKKTLAAFPSGTVLMPEESLVVPVDREAGEQYSDFLLFSENKDAPLLRVNRINNQLVIPVSYLAHGKDYRWQIKKQGKPYTGYFKIAHRIDQKNYQKEVSAIPHYHTLSPEAQLLLKAMKLKEWDFSYDMGVAAKALLKHSETSASSSATAGAEGGLR